MRINRVVVLVATTLLALACSSDKEDINTLPAFVRGNVAHATYDGSTDDLLTGGLGKSGLEAAAPPAFASATSPTAAELRVRAIYNNYRALVDMTASGGYGTFYGPNVDPSGNATLGEGKVAGDEYIAYDDPGGTGTKNVTMMVQVPATFDPNNPCIVTATSSGSRGVYGAIATAGEWGLKRGCAVAYTDKGSGNGAHDLANNTVNLVTGERTDAAAAGKDSIFTAQLSDADRAAFNAQDPNRFAFKHAHSKQNPEKDWGQDTLHAIEFAYYVLNQQLGKPAKNGTDRLRTFKPGGNTIVIASSVSNGGGAALVAAEQDSSGMISGVVAGEPQIQLAPDARRQVLRGGQPVAAQGKTLMDYGTIANLYQPCAALSSQVASAPGLAFVVTARATNRCTALKNAGLLTAATTDQQADEALQKLHAAGWERDSDLLHASHYAFAVPAIGVTYAFAYGRFGVEERVCGFTFGATDAAGAPTAATAANVAGVFASGNGIPPTAGVNIISDTAKNGPINDTLAVSPSTNLQDYDFDGAQCLRGLAAGSDANAQRVQGGIQEVLRTANLHGKPAILVQGRADALVPINHASRAWLAQNHLAEGNASNARLLEITNGQHFDTFIGTAGLTAYANYFVPVHRYFVQAMDLMYDHLKSGKPLPDSQVVRTTPRGSAATALTAANVPLAPLQAAAADKITFQGDALSVPE